MRPGRVAPHHRLAPWWSAATVVLMVFCLSLPETNASRPGPSLPGPAHPVSVAQCDAFGGVGEHVGQGV